MIETQTLLSKIAALRQRLDQAQGLVRDASSQAASLLVRATDGADTVRRVEWRISDGSRQNDLLESTLRQLQSSAATTSEPSRMPAQLTARAARVLRRGQELLGELRALADEPVLQYEQDSLLAAQYRETMLLADLILRTIQAFPQAPSAQLRLSEGLELVLNLACDRLTILKQVVAQQRQEQQRLDELAGLLTAVASGTDHDAKPFEALAQAVLADANEARPLRFFTANPSQPALFLAAHSLTVAQVIARCVRQDADWRGRALEPIMAALVHDVGMLRVPVEILTHPGPLTDAQRRLVEAHPRDGAELVAKLGTDSGMLAAATLTHHERIDGSGYPAGLRETQLLPLARLLAVCDVYAALCCARPHRAALETRTALTDTLLLAEQGALDRYQAERLLGLSFYPVGTAVELADGALGVVVATHQGRRDLSSPARPVVAVVTDSQGRHLPTPQHVDLAECEGRSVVRSLSSAERREYFGKRYPLWI